MINDWGEEWEVDVEARRGFYELSDWLGKQTAFQAFCAQRDQDPTDRENTPSSEELRPPQGENA